MTKFKDLDPISTTKSVFSPWTQPVENCVAVGGRKLNSNKVFKIKIRGKQHQGEGGSITGHEKGIKSGFSVGQSEDLNKIAKKWEEFVLVSDTNLDNWESPSGFEGRPDITN